MLLQQQKYSSKFLLGEAYNYMNNPHAITVYTSLYKLLTIFQCLIFLLFCLFVQFTCIFEEITPYLEDMLSMKHMGVVKMLVEKCQSLGTKQKKIVKVSLFIVHN